ncbi:MAG: elongation factor P [Alphaproteobacteria bacterium]|nr:elongation factor P [Alphaproteobacteria bacterium]
MKISAGDIRVGNVLEHNNKLWVVAKTQHVQPGKGGAFMQVEMKELRGGQKMNERFRTEDKVEKVFLEEKEFQFLYKDGDDLHFMDQETFEQIQLNTDVVGDSVAFLEDGMTVNICMYENDPISVSLPQTVVLEIVEAEPVVKGQTAASSYKPAILSNGVKIMVPQHIEAGTKVVVDTNTASYVERAK